MTEKVKFKRKIYSTTSKTLYTPIPKELSQYMKLNKKDYVCLYGENGNIIITKIDDEQPEEKKDGRKDGRETDFGNEQ